VYVAAEPGYERSAQQLFHFGICYSLIWIGDEGLLLEPDHGSSIGENDDRFLLVLKYLSEKGEVRIVCCELHLIGEEIGLRLFIIITPRIPNCGSFSGRGYIWKPDDIDSVGTHHRFMVENLDIQKGSCNSSHSVGDE
jgi:hypothetical protein